jgi:hypothetical protein
VPTWEMAALQMSVMVVIAVSPMKGPSLRSG